MLLTADPDEPLETVEASAERAVEEAGQAMAPLASQPDDDRQPRMQVEDEGPLSAGPELGEIHVE